jgi:hypothetical protein
MSPKTSEESKLEERTNPASKFDWQPVYTVVRRKRKAEGLKKDKV